MSLPGPSCRDTVGISGIGYFLPDGVLTSLEMSRRSGIPESVFLEKIGIGRKHIAGPGLHPAEMAVRAANSAIKNAGIDPLELDLVVYCGLGHYDYRFWSPAAKVQDKTGAKNAYSFEIRNGCNGGNLGLHTCKELLLGDPEKEYALVVCSEKLSMAINTRTSVQFPASHLQTAQQPLFLRKTVHATSFWHTPVSPMVHSLTMSKFPMAGRKILPPCALPMKMIFFYPWMTRKVSI